MNVTVKDFSGSSTYASWSEGEYEGLTFTHESPGGMISASFNIPAIYSLPYQWANVFNQVEIYHGPTLVWSGLVYALERYWGDKSGIKVDCVGNAARLAWYLTSTNLVAEKGSTYINDHIIGHPYFSYFLTTGVIEANDYLIPDVREYQPRKTLRNVLDDIQFFNDDYAWYVWGNALYFTPTDTTAFYVTTTEFSEGSLRQELGEFTNYLWYTYRDLAGVVQADLLEDTATIYPVKAMLESYSDNMTAAQALQLATASLNKKKVLGATAQMAVYKAWDLSGAEVHPSEIRPGRVIRIEGIVPPKASPGEAFVDNDFDAFVIASTTYNHDAQSVDVAPGRLPHTLPKALASK